MVFKRKNVILVFTFSWFKKNQKQNKTNEKTTYKVKQTQNKIANKKPKKKQQQKKTTSQTNLNVFKNQLHNNCLFFTNFPNNMLHCNLSH